MSDSVPSQASSVAVPVHDGDHAISIVTMCFGLYLIEKSVDPSPMNQGQPKVSSYIPQFAPESVTSDGQRLLPAKTQAGTAVLLHRLWSWCALWQPLIFLLPTRRHSFRYIANRTMKRLGLLHVAVRLLAVCFFCYVPCRLTAFALPFTNASPRVPVHYLEGA